MKNEMEEEKKMKKKKTADQLEKRKVEFRKRMEYEKHKRGITKRKEDYEEQRGRKYVRDLNEMYSIIDPAKHIEITEGTKREGKKHCSTKSQWKYNREELEKEGKVTPEIIEIAKNNREISVTELKIEEDKVKIPRRIEKIMLVIDKKVYVKNVEIEPCEKICIGKIKTGKEEHEIEIEQIYPDEKEMYKTDYGEMTGKMLVEISIKTGVKIYEMK